MLTFKDKGKAIAVIHGGPLDGEIISVTEEEKNTGGSYYSDSEDEFYSDDDYEDDINDKFFDLHGQGKLVPVPSVDTRQVTYIAGPSGSGKSTYASEQAMKYRKLFPKNPIYIFSRLDNDSAFDSKFSPPPIRVKINESLITNPIDITKQIKGGALVIFDDVDTIPDEKIRKAVVKLENDILEVGRHQNVYIICTSHLINGNDKKFSRTILNEAHTVTVFPKSGSSYQINYMLKNYMGCNKKQIDHILSLPSRWVTVIKGYPQAIIHEGGCFLL